jgi:hypothetical protein
MFNLTKTGFWAFSWSKKQSNIGMFTETGFLAFT